MAYPHDPLTESQVRHADVVKNDPTTTFSDLATESEARHVDEFAHARAADLESDGAVG